MVVVVVVVSSPPDLGVTVGVVVEVESSSQSSDAVPNHWSAVAVSPANSSGPCHCPIGEISCGVAPSITSNWRSRQAFSNEIVTVPTWPTSNGTASTSVCGQALAPPGIAYTAALAEIGVQSGRATWTTRLNRSGVSITSRVNARRANSPDAQVSVLGPTSEVTETRLADPSGTPTSASSAAACWTPPAMAAVTASAAATRRARREFPSMSSLRHRSSVYPPAPPERC